MYNLYYSFLNCTCNPIGQLQDKKLISIVALKNFILNFLHGPFEAYRVRVSELWGEITLNVMLVHLANIFLANWPSARPLSAELREAWMVVKFCKLTQSTSVQ